MENQNVSVIKPFKNTNRYIPMMDEYLGFAFTFLKAKELKGSWRSLDSPPRKVLDLEIGCGNGLFFEHYANLNPERSVLGIEAKFKPLIQTMRRVTKVGLENARGLRLDAEKIEEIFSASELNRIFIFFPDPWLKRRHKKNRLLKKAYFEKLHRIQLGGESLIIKTDSEDYFDFILTQVPTDLYSINTVSRNLHNSEWAQENFITGFESIFLRQGLPIFYLHLTNKKS